MTIDITGKIKKLRRLRKAHEIDQSIELCKKLLNRLPDNAALHYELGLNYQASTQPVPAVAHFNQAIKLGMRKAAVFVGNAASLNRLCRYDEAETMARAAITLAPGNLPGMRNLITSLLAQGKYQEAAVIGEQLILHSPDNASDCVLYGRVMINLERYDDTILLANKAIELRANCAEARYLLSRVYLSVQQWDKALAMVEQALAIAPSTADYQAMQANMLEHLGRFDEAFAIANPMVNKPRPRNGLAVMVYARLARRFDKQAHAIKLLEELVSEKNTYVSTQQAALSLLGALYESLGHYDQAFAAVDKANKAQPLRYSDTNSAAHSQYLQGWFTRERLLELSQASNDEVQPIFIVGMPRSGTSLTEKILSRHPGVQAGGETLHLQLLLYKHLPDMLSNDQPFPECLGGLTPEIADQAADKFLSDMGVAVGKRITEKRPTNFMHLGAIAKLFPGAKIIHCTRNPLDTALSCYFTQFTSTTELGFSQDLELIGNYIKRYEEMMAHWHEVLPLPILDLSYEALATSPGTEIRKLLEFCDLSWHEACLNPEESTVVTTTASYNQTRKPINTQSIGRWKMYEKQLQPLRESLGLVDQSAAA